MRLLPGFGVSRRTEDSRVLEDADVKVRGLFRFAVEPQAGTDLLFEFHELVGVWVVTRKLHPHGRARMPQTRSQRDGLCAYGSSLMSSIG
jgi:hypothetical protein